jgi:hypothetical protein
MSVPIWTTSVSASADSTASVVANAGPVIEVEQIYRYHFTAQRLRKQRDYRSYQYYRRLISLVSALGGAGGGVGFEQVFPT